MLLLFPYFMLHILVGGEQMCSGEVDQVLGECKATCRPRAREEGRGQRVWNSFPSSSGTPLSWGMDAALGVWRCEWQDGAEHSPIFGQGDVHFTTRPLTHPSSPAAGGLSSQAL